MKYKIGDRVLIHSKSYIKKRAAVQMPHYYDFKFNSFTYTMLPYCNKIMTIKDMNLGTTSLDKGKIKYLFEEDDGIHIWYEEWFYPNTQAGRILFEDSKYSIFIKENKDEKNST